MLRLVPVSLRDANAFVAAHHRHHKPVAGHKLIDILRENLQSPSLFLGAIGDGKTRCVFQHRDEHSQTKPSIRGQLAAAKEAQAEQPTVQRHQKDKEAR